MQALISALGRLKQKDCQELEAGLCSIVGTRSARITQKDPISGPAFEEYLVFETALRTQALYPV